MLDPIKIIFICVAIALRHDSIASRFGHFGLSAGFLLYLAMLAGSAVLLIATGWIANGRIRWFWAILLAIASIPVISYEYASGEQMSYFSFVTIVDARGSLSDAMQAFPLSILAALASCTFLLFGIGIKPTHSPKIFHKFALAAPIICTVLVSSMLFARNGSGAAGLPPSWVGLGYSAYYVKARSDGVAGARSPVTIKNAGNPLARDIIIIVDESVAGHYLDINSANGVHSGLKDRGADITISNFGLASSITNCSMNTNVMLRFGGSRNDHQRILGTMPSIFSYAKAAGYHTNYLYAQPPGLSENYVTDAEREDIDFSKTFEEFPINDRDQEAAKLLAKIINDDKRDFVWLNKKGAHFPVNDRFPLQYAKYSPALPNRISAKPDGKNEENFLTGIGSNMDWRRYRNSYRNTITWSVGAFFEKLFKNANMEKATIIYTSDHGQSFHERGTRGGTTHCRANAEVEELIVPLVVIDASKNANSSLFDAAQRYYNASSQFRIFPSLLGMMDYDPAAVQNVYGDALDAQKPDPMTYFSRLYLWSNKEAQLQKVNIGDVIHPPKSDYSTE